MYRGKPIFHGLGNFVTITRALTIEGNDHPVRLAWAKKRRAQFGFEPDPEYPLYPFHPESKNLMIADCIVSADGVVNAGFTPGWMQKSGAPLPLGNCGEGRAVLDYIIRITRQAGLDTEFSWEGDRVVFR